MIDIACHMLRCADIFGFQLSLLYSPNFDKWWKFIGGKLLIVGDGLIFDSLYFMLFF